MTTSLAVRGRQLRQETVALWNSDRRPVAEPVRRDSWTQLWLVLAVSLGASGVYAIIDLLKALANPVPLSGQTATLHGSYTPIPWLDLLNQVVAIAFDLAPVLVALYLLTKLPVPPRLAAGWRGACRRIGLDTRRPLPDLVLGSLLALAIGLPGLLLYLGSYALGLSLNVDPGNLPAHWWSWVVYLLSAAENAVLEETIVVGFTVTQLRRAGVAFGPTVLFSAILRGSYHLYQGFGAFVGNAIMGVIFVLLYRRTRRVMPLVVAHTLIDTVAFIGYALLAGHVSWLPA